MTMADLSGLHSSIGCTAPLLRRTASMLVRNASQRGTKEFPESQSKARRLVPLKLRRRRWVWIQSEAVSLQAVAFDHLACGPYLVSVCSGLSVR
jgi:hypothetical protein